MTKRTRTITWTDPLADVDRRKGMAGIDVLRALISGDLDPPPMWSVLGHRLVEAEPGRAVFTLTPQEFHSNRQGGMHGGVAATLLDSAMACAVQTLLPAGQGYTTIELHVNYLRAITPEVGEIRTIGTAIHTGGRMATAEGRVVDASGRLYCHGTTTLMLFRPRPPKDPEPRMGDGG